MHRRGALKLFAGGGMALAAGDLVPGSGANLFAATSRSSPLQVAQEAIGRGLPDVKITDVKVILTQIEGSHLVNAKVMTSEPGLYGIGCGTHAERPLLVATDLEQYLKPMVIGRSVGDIEDIWQTANVAPYWRGGGWTPTMR